MKVLAVIGLLFCCYCTAKVLQSWEHRDRINVAIWFVIISVIGGICIGLLGRYSWMALVGLFVASLIVAATKGR
jgi:hypothetical protein